MLGRPDFVRSATARCGLHSLTNDEFVEAEQVSVIGLMMLLVIFFRWVQLRVIGGRLGTLRSAAGAYVPKFADLRRRSLTPSAPPPGA
jgi:hypothetical protein